MQTRTRPVNARPAHPRADKTAVIEDLEARFAAFRRHSRPFARIPPDLREAILAAVRQGVSPGQLRRVCGLSTSQLDQWRRPAPGRGGPVAELRPARVFSVMDAAPAPSSPPVATSAQGDALELRLGPWSVSVRLAPQQPAGRE